MKAIDNEKKHILFAISLGACAVFVNCFISLFITPRITNTIGIESYGYVTLAKNFVAYATILTTALNSYAARYMSIAYIKNEKEKFKEYFSTVFWGDFYIGVILLSVGLFFSLFIDSFLKVEANLVTEVKWLFSTCFVSFFINTISTVFLATGHVKDRMETINLIRTGSYFVEIAVLIFGFWVMRPSVWYVGLSSLCMSLFVLCGTYILTYRTLPERSISRNYISKTSFVELVGNGFWNSANSLGNTLNSGLDLLISNIMLTSTAMGQVSIAKTINNIIFALYVAVAQAFQPKLIKCYSEGNAKRLINMLKRSMKVSGIITNCILAGFYVLGKDFLELWIPGQDISEIYLITLIAMLPCVSEGCVYPLYYVYTLTVKNRVPCVVTIIGGLANVASMYFLLKYTSLGVYSIVITTAVIMNLIVGLFNPIYICKCLKIRISTFFVDILVNILMLVCAAAVMQMANNFILYNSSWLSLIIKIMMLAFLGLLIQSIIAFVHLRFVGQNNESF